MSGVVEAFYAFEDIETTGLKKGHDEVCEIAVYLTDLNFKKVATFDKRIQFDHSKMTREAAEKNGYDPKVWAYEAVPFYEFSTWLDKWVPYPNVAIPVGHNVEFDYDILDHRYYKPSNKFFRLSYSKICTLQIARTLKSAGVISVPDCKLETVCEALKIKVEGPQHRAWPDMMRAKAIFDFHQAILKS